MVLCTIASSEPLDCSLNSSGQGILLGMLRLLILLWKGAIVVMDNLKVHHAERVRIAIESVGVLVKFLPPYSPDLSPIEQCLSKLKQFLRSCEARTPESLHQAMSEVVNYITEDDAYEKVQSLWSIYLKIAVNITYI
ncbi:transposase [Brasilonema sp. CT11]|nr:transposase [Brasilonema sp. CT11]